MVGSDLFYLVPTLIIKHSDIYMQDLAKTLLFWEHDLLSASQNLSSGNVFGNKNLNSLKTLFLQIWYIVSMQLMKMSSPTYECY